MAELPEFQKKQYAFASHIRDPHHVDAPPDTEDRRMAIYRELFFNNLKSLLSQTFPVLKKLHSKQRWNRLIRLFMVHHKAETPYFMQIPHEFLLYLQNEHEASDEDFPFLLELAHYEWAELALSVAEAANDLSQIDAAGDLLEGIPVKSQLAWVYAYQFPVHRISEDYQPDAPGEQPTFLAICRKANDDMDFMELNPVTARLLELIDENNAATGRQLLEKLATEIDYSNPAALIEHGDEAMAQMRDAEILLGTRIA